MNLLSGMAYLLSKIIQSITAIELEELVKNVFFSLLAALIFWIVFNFLPDSRRRKKIRPKVEFDIYEFYHKLFEYIQKPFYYNKHSSSLLQNEIFAGKIAKEDFETWLQNKCLNESFLYDDMAKVYLCIGDDLQEITLDLCEKAKNIYMFTTFLSANEILLIKKITTKLRVYSYIGDCGSLVGNKVYKPVNPNMAYMAVNFFDIYMMFLELQRIVLAYKYIDISINDSIAWHFKWSDTNYAYYRGEYKKCLIRFRIAELQHRFPEHLWSIKFLCLYKTGKKEDALIFLESKLLTSQLQLISIRNSFDNLYLQEDVKRVLIKARGEAEYIDMVECLKREKDIMICMTEQAEIIKKHYVKKNSSN